MFILVVLCLFRNIFNFYKPPKVTFYTIFIYHVTQISMTENKSEKQIKNSSSFKQQRLPSWQPILTPKTNLMS